MEYDFSGYVTKANVKCTDGRVIAPNAFQHHDGERVPLVWQHMHNDPSNVLGFVDLENRRDGLYGYGSFNESEKARDAREAVVHGDIDSMSIFAVRIDERGNRVSHGDIKEVSLVISGANKGAKIDNLAIEHADGEDEIVDDEAVITTFRGIDTITHADENEEEGDESGSSDDTTIGEIVDSMTEEQKNAMYFLIGKALEDAGVGEGAQESAEEGGETMEQSDMGGNNMHYNVFEKNKKPDQKVLSHDDIQAIFSDAQEMGSLKKSILAHTATYGIENIETLFPDAKNVTNPPEWIKRRTEWVSGVINGARHSPFSRIKTMTADITADEARARGYIKGNQKVEEVFPVMQRTTTPTTVYKKQKLDRDDIIDITDFDVVNWLWQEMRMMLDEELARAILIGDGRSKLGSNGKANPDKINEENIRPIYTDDDLYSSKVQLASTAKTEDIMEGIVRAMDEYEGSGAPTMYCTQSFVTDMLLLKDTLGRRLYNSEAEITSFLGVSSIVKVPVMKNVTRSITTGSGDTATTTTYDLRAIIVNLSDYTIGTDKGGEIARFDDFDIDYNQYKYLLETRLSGALIHPKSAVVVEQAQAAKG